MRTLLTRAHAIVDHPWTNLLVALVLIGSSLAEAGEALIEPVLTGDVGTHHGVLVFGVAQFLKTLPEVTEGFQRLIHGPETEAD